MGGMKYVGILYKHIEQTNFPGSTPFFTNYLAEDKIISKYLNDKEQLSSDNNTFTQLWNMENRVQDCLGYHSH